ncbi:2-hydroxyacyl-CoA dehydratase family protein [Tsuneonella sp. CC-YZS046]|uniref:2-hydroxyacyl-CoA dehydratase subunit D n=1 Tax=Tsuneonella sp. CC-YZS046 TaxID=3042152 RepID=UPI002D774C84|nr:2-hydroxyacyl-CoA dehydratase family protein [Tsuneonella sp. CC-YZS046]WRO65328.1 2-hydroxyacyl-CoA dehydratase family protein [Tsuneonella sp. CC-YZS046]
MHFPVELAHAAGALPVIIQEAEDPITDGEGAVFSFYCGYNRSVADQALKGRLKFLDAIMFGDHCVQLLGTADIIRWHDPELPIVFEQPVSSLDMDWAFDETRSVYVKLKEDVEELLGARITDDALKASISLFNRNRQLIRKIYEMRVAGTTDLSARQMQHIIKSSMVMDRQEHTGLLERLVEAIEARPASRRQGMPVYLSGHLCQAPKLELLDMIESTGTVVVGDDLYHGYRFISTDIDEEDDPMTALANWYLRKNEKVPCPTRADGDADWDEFLVRDMRRTGAEGLIVLVAKFCEPHMYYFPEIQERCRREGIPMLKLETEHDSMPMEAFKTRLETFVEVARRRRRHEKPESKQERSHAQC